MEAGGDPGAASFGEPFRRGKSGAQRQGRGGSPWEGRPHQHPGLPVMRQAGALQPPEPWAGVG